MSSLWSVNWQLESLTGAAEYLKWVNDCGWLTDGVYHCFLHCVQSSLSLKLNPFTTKIIKTRTKLTTKLSLSWLVVQKTPICLLLKHIIFQNLGIVLLNILKECFTIVSYSVYFFAGLCQQDEVCSKSVINSCSDCIRSRSFCAWCKQLVRNYFIVALLNYYFSFKIYIYF